MDTWIMIIFRKYYKKTNVYLQHSVSPPSGDSEGLPISIMEAMAMNLPVVSTFHSGIPELVENGVNGYLVEERDLKSYAISLAKALEMGNLSINRQKIKDQFNLQKQCKKLIATIEEFKKQLSKNNQFA